MKKPAEAVPPQLDLAAELADVKARLASFELRLEKLDPTPPLAVREPYPVGSLVYGIADLEARYPLAVLGYRGDRILVRTSEGERAFPVVSVRPLAQCPNADRAPTEDELYARLDPKAREYWQGRRAAEIAAKTSAPAGPFIPEQRRYS